MNVVAHAGLSTWPSMLNYVALDPLGLLGQLAVLTLCSFYHAVSSLHIYNSKCVSKHLAGNHIIIITT